MGTRSVYRLPQGRPLKSDGFQGFNGLEGNWWSQSESNRRPLECHSSALPTELWPHSAGPSFRPGDRSAVRDPHHVCAASRPAVRRDQAPPAGFSPAPPCGEAASAFLVVAADADNIGDVVVFLFLFLKEGIVIVVAKVDIVIFVVAKIG